MPVAQSKMSIRVPYLIAFLKGPLPYCLLSLPKMVSNGNADPANKKTSGSFGPQKTNNIVSSLEDGRSDGACFICPIF